MYDEADLRRIVSLLDYTRLKDNDTEAEVATFLEQAQTNLGHVAAVCVYPQFVRLAYAIFIESPIRVASVANFPMGDKDLEDVLIEINGALEDGAQEIDVVLPYKRYIAGDMAYASEFVAACNAACHTQAILKVILEAGAFKDKQMLAQAAQDVLLAGADFIKTSTGKIAQGASLECARVMLQVIKDLRTQVQKPLGFKASGGIKTIADAFRYISLADEILGKQCVCPATFRIGASQLLNEIKQYNA